MPAHRFNNAVEYNDFTSSFANKKGRQTIKGIRSPTGFPGKRLLSNRYRYPAKFHPALGRLFHRRVERLNYRVFVQNQKPKTFWGDQGDRTDITNGKKIGYRFRAGAKPCRQASFTLTSDAGQTINKTGIDKGWNSRQPNSIRVAINAVTCWRNLSPLKTDLTPPSSFTCLQSVLSETVFIERYNLPAETRPAG